MSTPTQRPTRREERRAQTIAEIKALAMQQIAEGGPDAVSLSGIVRQMAMSQAAVYRYFENKDALLADLVVDAYDDFADHLAETAEAASPGEQALPLVLSASRTWALAHPNAYRLIFQSSIGSGKDFAVERTIPAASRSMGVMVDAMVAAAEPHASRRTGSGRKPAEAADLDDAVRAWATRSGLSHVEIPTLRIALSAWTRLHGIISLELGGHLDATGISAGLLYAAEVEETVRRLGA